MARLFSSGFELASNAEFASVIGSVAYSTSTVRSGAYSLRMAPGTNDAVVQGFGTVNADTNGPYFQRVYIRIAASPAVTANIMQFGSFTLGGHWTSKVL